MSGSSGNPSMSNGSVSSVVDPLKRLSSFKTPRDLSLGGIKPNKKVFTPNLNVSRNKNKGPNLPTVTRDKKDEKGRRDKKDRNKNVRNGPNIIKSSGVFSEGMGSAETRLRASHGGGGGSGRDSDPAPTLQKPFIRVKDVWKIDKELEEQKIKKVLCDGSISDDDVTLDPQQFDKDAPVSLPLSDGGWLHNKPLAAIKVKQEVVVKQEPEDDNTQLVDDKKPIVDVKREPGEEIDIVSLLRSDKAALIMLQFPDTLPGLVGGGGAGAAGSAGGAGAAGEEGRKKGTGRGEGATSQQTNDEGNEKPEEERCRLSGLQEGEIGKLLIHRSGRVCLALGDTMFEVAAGTQASFRQELVSVGVDEATRSANLISLGALPHKLNLLPHWESMLADITI